MAFFQIRSARSALAMAVISVVALAASEGAWARQAGSVTREGANKTRPAPVVRVKAERLVAKKVVQESKAGAKKGSGLTKAPGKNARLAAAGQDTRALSKSERRALAREALAERKAAAAGARRGFVAAPAALRQATHTMPAPRESMGRAFGLHDTHDALELKSSVALVVDQDTSEVLFGKNADAVLPIASLTKLMTALVVVEARQSLDEVLEITEQDIDTEKGSRSRLAVGTQLTRGELLHLALMSSENRAANALGRHYPGGLWAGIQAMNRKAQALGMFGTRYVEPTGLSSENQSSAADLAKLVKAAYQFPLIRELSTSPEREVWTGTKTLQYRNTNGLVRSPSWEIGLQKTGYIAEAGRCLVMQARLAGRRLIMVFLDSTGKYSRIGDAERVRHWLEGVEVQSPSSALRVSAPAMSEPAARPSLTAPTL